MAAAGPDSTIAHLSPVQGDPFGTHPAQKRTTALALGALGVVFGDIGTSPLYTIRECFNGPHAVALDEINIFGVVSLIFWSLTMVVTVKYVAFILRADNRNEGGIFALLGLILGSTAQISPRLRAAILLGAILGAALLYGDGIITPAISVLSAIEGLEVATRAAKPAVVPLTCAVLVGLFLVQHRGTADIGKVFGPVMVLWGHMSGWASRNPGSPAVNPYTHGFCRQPPHGLLSSGRWSFASPENRV
jgi:KUP system potassium uptake protein